MKGVVFVPINPNKPTFEAYVGIVRDEYTNKAKSAIETFVQDTSKKYWVRTLQGEYLLPDKISVKNDLETVTVNTYSIQPTKWCVENDRIWLFDQNTLSELDVFFKKEIKN
jgi:hypothetical protein